VNASLTHSPRGHRSRSSAGRRRRRINARFYCIFPINNDAGKSRKILLHLLPSFLPRAQSTKADQRRTSSFPSTTTAGRWMALIIAHHLSPAQPPPPLRGHEEGGEGRKGEEGATPKRERELTRKSQNCIQTIVCAKSGSPFPASLRRAPRARQPCFHAASISSPPANDSGHTTDDEKGGDCDLTRAGEGWREERSARERARARPTSTCGSKLPLFLFSGRGRGRGRGGRRGRWCARPGKGVRDPPRRLRGQFAARLRSTRGVRRGKRLRRPLWPGKKTL